MLDITILNKLKESVQIAHTDYSAEVLTLALLNNGIHESQFVIQAIGVSKRGKRKEVSAFNIKEDKEALLFMHTNRSGIYDGLPEFIFHHPTNNYRRSNTAEVIEEIKRFRNEERLARLFFLPYEQEFFRLGVLLQELWKDFESPILDQQKQNLFATCWPIFTKLDEISGSIFLCLLPHIHSFRDDFKKVEECLSLILNIPIKIYTAITAIEYKSSNISLGDLQLGFDSIIGSNTYDGEKDICIEVGPLTKVGYCSFQPLGAKHNLIEELCDFFIGANYFISVRYLCEKPNESLCLNQEHLLGINTYM